MIKHNIHSNLGNGKINKNMFKRIWTESRHFKAKDSTQNERLFLGNETIG